MDGKEPQVEVPLVPATPIKPVPLKPVPIYTPGVINQMGYHANGAVACYEFSIGQEKLCRSDVGSNVAEVGSNVAGDSGNTCEHTASDAASSFSKLGFCDHLFAVEAESRNSSVTKGFNEGLNNSFVPSFILDNIRDPQGKSYMLSLLLVVCHNFIRFSPHVSLELCAPIMIVPSRRLMMT